MSGRFLYWEKLVSWGLFCQINQLKILNIKRNPKTQTNPPQAELYNIFILVRLLEAYPLMHYVQDVVELMYFSFSPESLTCPFPVLTWQL